MKFSRTKRIIILILALVILVGSVFAIRGCSAPPKYEEIEARFKQLMEDSYGVNVILFGEGLPTYERVYEHETKVFEDKANDKTYYYYEIKDEELGTVYGYRYTEVLHYVPEKSQRTNEDHVFLDKNGNYYYPIDYDDTDKDKKVSSYENTESGETYYFYVIEDESYGTVYEYRRQATKYITGVKEKKPDGELLYEDAESGYLYYQIDYKEPENEFYYTNADPSNYNYVRADAPYRTVEAIKTYAEAVYSKNYMKSLYSSLFDGVASGGAVMNARYVEHTRSDNTVWLTQSNTYESLFSECRVYLFDSAEIIKWGSNRKFVRISIDSYLPSNPQKIEKIEVNLVLQNGQWFLDSPTF